MLFKKSVVIKGWRTLTGKNGVRRRRCWLFLPVNVFHPFLTTFFLEFFSSIKPRQIFSYGKNRSNSAKTMNSTKNGLNLNLNLIWYSSPTSPGHGLHPIWPKELEPFPGARHLWFVLVFKARLMVSREDYAPERPSQALCLLVSWDKLNKLVEYLPDIKICQSALKC